MCCIQKIWSSFHAKLPGSKRSKIPKSLRGIMLQSHLCGHAKDLCKDISFDEIASENGVDKICKTLHKMDALTVISKSTKRGPNENFQNFDSRFAATIAKMKSHGSRTLHESLTGFILSSNRSVDVNQRISILPAGTSHSNDS